MLPDCFQPDLRTARTLSRVEQGLTVDRSDALPLVVARLLRYETNPTPRSGFELTPDGSEALRRARWLLDEKGV